MSHLARLVVCGCLALVACSSPKPPETPAELPVTEPAAEAPAEAATSAAPAPASEAPAANGGSAPSVQTLFVRERRVPCQGEAAMQCLQVRESESAEWRNFYGHIDGFEYEESHAYELRVELTPIAHPPADGSALRYRLLEVVSKRQVEPAPE